MQAPPTALMLPRTLPYPITVHRLHLSPGDRVVRTKPLFSYSYLNPRNDGSGAADKLIRDWDSPIEGDVVSWGVKIGEVLRDST